MAPQLESEDEISEIEEVTETLLLASSLNSPLMGRKETITVEISGEGKSLDIEIDTEKNNLGNEVPIDVTIYKGTRADDLRRSDYVQDSSFGKNNNDAVKHVSTGKSTNASPASGQLEPDSGATQEEKKILTSKLKSKNKLNLKLKFLPHSELRSDSNGDITQFSATLNLPSPTNELGVIEKDNNKCKKDKVRSRKPNKRIKESFVNGNKEDVTQPTNANLSPALDCNSSRHDKVNVLLHGKHSTDFKTIDEICNEGSGNNENRIDKQNVTDTLSKMCVDTNNVISSVMFTDENNDESNTAVSVESIANNETMLISHSSNGNGNSGKD